MKITLPTFSPINDFSGNINLNGIEAFRIKGGVGRGISKKVKNLSKGKNIKQLIKLKKSDFAKTKGNKAFKTGFFTPKAKITFTQLIKAYNKALILCYFDPECYI